MEISKEILSEFLVDFCWLSVLLLVGKFVRVSLKPLQKLFLPASIIGGFIGLMLGPYIFGKFGIQIIPETMLTTWKNLPGSLINIVFACLFLGFSIPSLKMVWQRGGKLKVYGTFSGTMRF